MWLLLAEWWYNTTYHTATQLTIYEVLYNQPVPVYLPYQPGESSNEAVDNYIEKTSYVISFEVPFNSSPAKNEITC